jgi:hypothetical protein
MATFATIVAGVLVFVLGQAFQRFVLEPIHEQRRVIADIAVALVFLANVGPATGVPEGYTVVGADEPIPASRHLRSLGARLRGSLWTIPFYRLWSTIRLVKPRKTILAASTALIGWSNGVLSGEGLAARSKLASLLALPVE